VDEVSRVETDSVQMPEADNRNQGRYYEQVLSRYLPDIHVLSRFAHLPEGADEPDESRPENEPREPFEEPEWELGEDPMDYLYEGAGESNEVEAIQASPKTQFDSQVETTATAILADADEHLPPPEEDLSYSSSHTQPEPRVENEPQLIVTIHPCGEKTRDLRHIRQLHGLLVSHPGNHHFAFAVSEGGENYMIEFPNDTTEISDEVLQDLDRYVGAENIIIRREKDNYF